MVEEKEFSFDEGKDYTDYMNYPKLADIEECSKIEMTPLEKLFSDLSVILTGKRMYFKEKPGFKFPPTTVIKKIPQPTGKRAKKNV